jgi:hypothetical protein
MGIDINALKSQFATMTKGSDSFVPGEGETRIRILPPYDRTSPFPMKKMGYHDVYGERILCPKETNNNEPCPICSRVHQLYKSKSEEDKALAGQLRAVQRFYFNIVVRGQEGKGVQKFGCGSKLTGKIVNIITTELAKDITDPEHGHDIVVVKTIAASAKGNFPDYTASYAVFQESPLGNNEWLDKRFDLDKEFICKSFDEIRDIIEKKLGPTMTTSYAPQPQQNVAYAAPRPVAPVAQPTPVVAPVQQVAQPAPVAVQTAPQPVSQPAPVAQPAPAPQAAPAAAAQNKSLSADDILTMLNQ